MFGWSSVPRNEPGFDDDNVEDFKELAERIKTEISEYSELKMFNFPSLYLNQFLLTQKLKVLRKSF